MYYPIKKSSKIFAPLRFAPFWGSWLSESDSTLDQDDWLLWCIDFAPLTYYWLLLRVSYFATMNNLMRIITIQKYVFLKTACKLTTIVQGHIFGFLIFLFISELYKMHFTTKSGCWEEEEELWRRDSKNQTSGNNNVSI